MALIVSLILNYMYVCFFDGVASLNFLGLLSRWGAAGDLKPLLLNVRLFFQLEPGTRIGSSANWNESEKNKY